VKYLLFILSTPSLFRMFHEWCRNSFCEETLEFIVKVREYKKHPNKKKAIAIIEEYVTGGERRVNFDNGNITEELRAKRERYALMRAQAKQKNFLDRVRTSDPRKADPNLFDDALAVAQDMVVSDTLRRWFLDDGRPVKDYIDRKMNKYIRGQEIIDQLLI
jgi:hypothetical protein